MFARTTTMSLTQFLNEPTVPPQQIIDDLSSFYKHINDFNNIKDTIQAQIDYNNKVLKNCDMILNGQAGPLPDIPLPNSLVENPIINNSIVKETAKEVVKGADWKESLKTIARFCDYLMNPSKILLAALNWTIEQSYIICLVVALASLLLYVLGDKGKLKYIPISLAIYIFLQGLGVLIK